MDSPRRFARVALMSAFAAAGAAAVRAAAPASTVIADIDLAKAFGARSAWRLVVSQGPPIDDTFGSTGDKVPGPVRLCLRPGASAPCDPALASDTRAESTDVLFSEPHYLDAARVLRPRGPAERPLLWVQTGSLHSGDGDQAVLTQVIAYQRGSDRFLLVYDHLTGRNNNQETRYVDAGPLKGDIVSVEPTRDAPFAFCVTVNALTPAYAYAQVLHYRSATRYADGNPLAVIDSEMPNIQQRLGLWRSGSPPPLPASSCPKPRLIRTELWCG